jgi:endonuclease-3
MVTPALFERYPTVTDLAQADPAEVEELVRSTGFYRNKTRNIIGMAQMIVGEFSGEFPQSIQDMVRLPGVARKTANVVLGVVFGLPTGVVVDTHVKRLAQRWGLTRENDPVKIERDLMNLLPKERWIDFGHQTIWHGRRTCHAKKPSCDECALAPLCPSNQGESNA